MRDSDATALERRFPRLAIETARVDLAPRIPVATRHGRTGTDTVRVFMSVVPDVGTQPLYPASHTYSLN